MQNHLQKTENNNFLFGMSSSDNDRLSVSEDLTISMRNLPVISSKEESPVACGGNSITEVAPQPTEQSSSQEEKLMQVGTSPCVVTPPKSKNQSGALRKGRRKSRLEPEEVIQGAMAHGSKSEPGTSSLKEILTETRTKTHHSPTNTNTDTNTSPPSGSRKSIKSRKANAGEGGCNFTQINLQHAKASTALIERWMQSCRTDHQNIFLIQEPYLGDGNKIRGLSTKYGNLLVKHNSRRPRTCIYVSNNVKCMLINELSGDDITAVIITINQWGIRKEILAISAYFPCDSIEDPPTRDFIEAINYAQRRDIPVIAGCDANAHNIVWGSTDTNPRGIALLEYLSTTNLTIVNKGNKPTFITKTRREVLDLTLVSNTLQDKIRDWKVLDDDPLSDHRYITFVLTGDLIQASAFRNPRKTNWLTFKTKLSDNLCNPVVEITKVAEIEKATELLEKAIIDAYENSCPLSYPRKTGTPWWTGELEQLRKYSRKLLNKAQRAQRRGTANQAAAWERYFSAQREYKNCIQKAKRGRWRQFCEETKDLSATAKLKKALTRNGPATIGSLEMQNGSYTQTNKDTLKHLMDTHFPDNREELSTDEVLTHFGEPQRLDWEIASQVVTKPKIEWAINSFSKYKSPGPDGIFPALLQEGLEIIIEYVLILLTACLALGYLPKSWRRVKAVFIPKPGKIDYHQAKSFRTISLTSFFVKCLERLVDRHFRDNSLRQFPIHSHQHAYQKGRSVDTAIHQLVSRIEKSLDQNQFALVAMLDIQGAFDNATFDSMCMAAERHGMEPTLLRWVKFMLESRKITAYLGDEEHTVAATKGCPQGGVLSPLLWCLVIDELLKELNKYGTYCQGYADDVALLLIDKFTDTLFGRMQEELNKVVSWCNEKGLSINSKKTELILFTKKRKIGEYTLPKIEDQTIHLSPQVKYLGVILDPKLNWQPHIEEKCQKACRIYWQCRNAFGKSWGLQPKFVYWIYTQIIRPILSFASHVWWQRVGTGTGRKPLCQIQRMACLGATGAVKSTPSAALDIALNLLPIDMWIKQCAVCTLTKMKAMDLLNKNVSLNKGHMKVLGAVKGVETIHMPMDIKITDFSFIKSFNTIETESWSNSHPCFVEGESMTVFTDGFKREGLAGAGILCRNPEVRISVSLGIHASVFQAEIFALITAASHIEEQMIRGRTIYICTNSVTALKAVSSITCSSLIVMDCVERLNQIGRFNRLFIVWAPDLAGVGGSEEAKHLAREGSESQFLGPEPYIPIPMASVKKDIYSSFDRDHEERWTSMETCRLSKNAMPFKDDKRTRFLLSLGRNCLRALIGILTGHSMLNHHLFKMKLSESPTCELCFVEEETVTHFLCSCPRLQTQRAQCFGSNFLMEDMARDLRVRDVMNYIHSTKRFEFLDV